MLYNSPIDEDKYFWYDEHIIYPKNIGKKILVFNILLQIWNNCSMKIRIDKTRYNSKKSMKFNFMLWINQK